MNKNIAIIVGDIVDADAYVAISHYLKTNDFTLHTYCSNTGNVKTYQGNKIIVENAESEKLDAEFDVIFLLANSVQEQQSLLNKQIVVDALTNAVNQQKLIITLGSVNLLIEDLIKYLNLPSETLLLDQVFTLQNSTSSPLASNTIHLHEIKDMLLKYA